MYCAGALIGLHLMEPYLSLTTAADTKYSKIIPAFQQLYEELATVDADIFLNTDQPALKFVSLDRFQHTRYDDDICQAIVYVSSSFQPQVTKLLKMILPQLAVGFQKQKGDIFGFGDCNRSSASSVANMDLEKLDQAPIHNLAAERSVGFINYELSRRGAKQLGSASASQVKAKFTDLKERREPGSFRSYSSIVRKGGRMPEIMLAWNRKQLELKKQGLQDKEIANVAVDRRRNKDLDALKVLGGPFTSAAAADEYISSTDIDEDTKVGHLYLEVRYARDTSLSLPKSSDLFRLMKNHRKLPINTYAVNLKMYLSNITSCAHVTLNDFSEAMDSILNQQN